MVTSRFSRVLALLLVLIVAAFASVGVFAQEPTPLEPVTVTIPAFSTSSIISVAMTIAGTFMVLLLTVAAVRVAPKFISAFRRALGAATG